MLAVSDEVVSEKIKISIYWFEFSERVSKLEIYKLNLFE
jgi:hypothetical protein